jgi:hypothetical protein
MLIIVVVLGDSKKYSERNTCSKWASRYGRNAGDGANTVAQRAIACHPF